MSFDSIKNCYSQTLRLQIIYIQYICINIIWQLINYKDLYAVERNPQTF